MLLRLFSKKEGLLITSFVLEAFIASFYVVITRSLTPIFLISVGLNINDLLMLNIVAYIFALILAYVLYKYGEFLKSNVKFKLLLVHGLERIFWGIIPLAVILSPIALYIDYIIAVALTIPTSIFINIIFFTEFNDKDLRRLLTRRGALGAVSNVIGQVAIVIVLASMVDPSKYLYLYLVAMFIGFVSTLLLIPAPIPSKIIERRKEIVIEEVSVKVVNVFLFLTALLASGAILGVVWAPYLMKTLKAPDYLAATLGLIQTVATIGSSIFWGGKPYKVYKYAIFLNSIIPISIALTFRAEIHLAIAAIYAFAYTGSNFLASFIYGELSKSIEIIKTPTMLVAANSLAQVFGLSIAYMMGQNTMYMFLTAATLSIIASLIALITIPEIAIPPERYVRAYSRILYRSSLSSYNFTMFTLKSTAILTIKLLGLSFIFLILYIIYRTLYYIIMIAS